MVPRFPILVVKRRGSDGSVKIFTFKDKFAILQFLIVVLYQILRYTSVDFYHRSHHIELYVLKFHLRQLKINNISGG